MIVKATSKDSLALAKIAIKMWSEHSLDELAKEFEETIDCEESAIFMLMVDNQAVGFAQCQLRHDYVEGTDSSPVGYLEGIFLEQEFRHRGHAKKLLAQCEEWAKNKGCTEFAINGVSTVPAFGRGLTLIKFEKNGNILFNQCFDIYNNTTENIDSFIS